MSINKEKDRYFKERRRKDEENKEWKKLSDFSPIQFFPLFLFQHFYSYFSAFSMFLSNKLISTITSKIYSILSLLFLFTFFFSFSFKTFFLLKNSIFYSLSTKSQTLLSSISNTSPFSIILLKNTKNKDEKLVKKTNIVPKYKKKP